MPDDPVAPVDQPVLKFEASLEELEKIVRQLEAGDLPLEQSVELFERGVGLTDVCRKHLLEAETRVDVVIRRGAKLTTEPFQPNQGNK